MGRSNALPPAPLAAGSLPTETEENKFEKIAQISPRAAILEARLDVEEALRTLAHSVKTRVSTPRYHSFMSLTRLLRSEDIIDEQTASLLDDLRSIGNSASHEGDVVFTPEEAWRYRTLANNVINRLLLRAKHVYSEQKG